MPGPGGAGAAAIAAMNRPGALDYGPPLVDAPSWLLLAVQITVPVLVVAIVLLTAWRTWRGRGA